MLSRFEKILRQLAAQETPQVRKAFLKARTRQVRKERIAFGVGVVLAAGSAGFASYALEGRISFGPLPSVLPPLSSAAPVNLALASHRTLDPDTTGSLPQDGNARSGVPGRGYVVRQVLPGAALVEGPDGMQAVSPGSVLPGAGRILSIKQSDQGWVVVTSETVIVSAPL
jgi:hypothetical protein